MQSAFRAGAFRGGSWRGSGSLVTTVTPDGGFGLPTRRPYCGPVARADLDKQPADVRRMFNAVAKRYDVTNDVLSLGQDRRWRRDVIEAVDPRPGETVLDLAAGTGTSSQPFADRGALVVPCDFSLGMLQVGKRARPALPFT